MKPSRLIPLLGTAFRAGQRVLIKSSPGIGKSEIVTAVCKEIDFDLHISHPAISDPTDYKGMPAVLADGRAEFLPFGDLDKLIKAEKPTVFFQDDIGQAPPAVQAALMQLNQARRVNGHKISDHVLFCGTTNDTTHMAGVAGMIEPLKSRWDTILELEFSLDDWCDWAYKNKMPDVLIAFAKFRPPLINNFKPTKELKNSACPRTVAAVGRWINCGVKDYDVIAGAAGEGFAGEFLSYLQRSEKMPDLDAIMRDPKSVAVPEEPALLYAVAVGLARRATKATMENCLIFMARTEQKEFEVCFVKDAWRINKDVIQCPASVNWSVKNAKLLA